MFTERDAYDMRQFLVGCPGLMPKTMQDIAQQEHATRIHIQHGLGSRDFQLLSSQWCTRYVNARRYVEQMLERNRYSLVSFIERHLECRIDVELPKVRLPPVSGLV